MRYLLAVAVVIVAAGLALGTLRHRADSTGTLRIAFSTGTGIEEIDLHGRHRRSLHRGSVAEGFAALPDGSRVITAAGRLVHVDGNGRLLDDLGPGILPTASPSGSQLVVSIRSRTRQEAQLWLVNVDGSGRRRLTSDTLDDLPSWSPDGSTILFTRFAPGALSADAVRSWLETLPALGGRPRRLTSSGYDSGGRYSPDGRSIVFGSARDRSRRLCGEDECRYLPQLYLMRADGSNQHRITNDHLLDSLPVFANDSTIVYSRADADPYSSELYRIDVDGTCRRRLTHDALQDVLPTVIPGTGGTASACPRAQSALPSGPNFNTARSTFTPEVARSWHGVPLYWIGAAVPPFVLTELTINEITPPGRASSKTAYLIYDCSPARGDCTRQLQLIMTPVCARPTFPAFGHGAVETIRGVPRIRYGDRDELAIGHVIVTIYGDRPARELAERELRSLSASAGHLERSQRLPLPPREVLRGLGCQPPAISNPLPGHP
jgi:hypothetical protein